MKLYTTITGTGNTSALFLHGLWGGGNYFRTLDTSQLPFTKKYFPDELGFGKSPKPVIDYTPEKHCELLHQTVAQEESITVIGHSFGAMLALYYAAFYPQQVKQVILISPVLYRNIAEAKQFISTNKISQLTISQPLLAKAICKAFCSTGILGRIAPLVTQGMKRNHISGCTEHTWQSYYSTFTNCLVNDKFFDTAQSVVSRTPTLAIYGSCDPYVGKGAVKELVSHGLATHVLAGYGHQVLFDQYNEVLAAMTLPFGQKAAELVGKV